MKKLNKEEIEETKLVHDDEEHEEHESKKRPVIAPKPDYIYQYRDHKGNPVFPKVININLNF